MTYILFINRDICGIFNDKSLAQQAFKKYKDYIYPRPGVDIDRDELDFFSFYFGWEERYTCANIVEYPTNTPLGFLKNI